jgi:ABC-type long-subunit fatty acid transport system fused permease/ATPase subunit
MSATGSERTVGLRVVAPGGARLAIDKTELLLSDKRLGVGLLRTGLGVLALPLAILTVLVAVAQPDSVARALEIPLVVACVALAVIGTVILFRAIAALDGLERRLLPMRRKGGPLGLPD